MNVDVKAPDRGYQSYMKTLVPELTTEMKHFSTQFVMKADSDVNGPGEMADADYGYVGAGRGKISLYKGKVCVEKNIPEEEAVERLLEFIRTDREENQQ